MSAPRRHPALDAWGEYDRDDPFPLFAQVRVAGPVHEARLADGHAAWRVVGHEEARAALANPRSRRTCTRRRRAARRSSRTAFPGLRWPATCWSSTHPTTPGCGGGLARLQQAAGRRAGGPGSGRSSKPSLLAAPPLAGAPTALWDLRGGLRFPPPIHGDQRAARIPNLMRPFLGSCQAICVDCTNDRAAAGRRGQRRHCIEQHRWRHPTPFRRARAEFHSTNLSHPHHQHREVLVLTAGYAIRHSPTTERRSARANPR